MISQEKPSFAKHIMRFVRSETVQALVVLMLILNVGFWSALWGDRTLISSAALPSIMPHGAFGVAPPPGPDRSPDAVAPAWGIEPAMAFNHEQFWAQHHLPLWNPYVGYGAPWAAAMLPQPFFPLSFLVALHPTPRTVSWFLILRLWTAGLFSYLFLRYFIGHAAALAGAIACMLTGYFILFLNIDNLSTDVLLPAVFYAIERLVRQGSIKAALLAALAIYVVLTSGMPESAMLILLYGYVYFFFRTLTVQEFRRHFQALLRNFVLANVLGFALAAYLLLPLLEFLQHGLDGHRPSITGLFAGLGYVPTQDYRELLLYLLPLANGPLFMNLFPTGPAQNNLLGYFGVTVFALGTLSLTAVGRNARRFWREDNSLLTSFFFVSATAFLLKYLGHPAVNWIGRLPLLNLVLFPKYIQPLLGFAVAMLCGFGASYLFSRRARLSEVLAVPLAVLVLIATLANKYAPQLRVTEKSVYYFYLNVIFGIIALMLLSAAMVCTLSNEESAWDRWRRRLGQGAVLALITTELLCNFAYPEYYVINPLPPATLNPYNGAPYIQFLKQRSGDYYRVFSRSAYLYPNWSSAFGLYDVRYLAAIHFNDFFQFVRAFLAAGPVGFTGDLGDRFTGESFPNPASWKQRRFFQLSSIRYLVGGDISFSAPEVLPLISNVLGQNQTRIRNENLHYIERRVFTIDGEARDVFFEHPPASRLALSTVVPANGPILTFSPAFDPRVFGRSGDGVDFTLELQEPDGKVSTLYHRYMDAKQNPGDRHWLDTHIDLRRYAGKKITLLFSTGPGPRGDAAWDWAGWGGLRFVVTEPAQQSPRAIREVYDGETTISEYPDVLPRVSVFYSAVPVSSQTEALSRIQDPSLDIWRQLVISRDGADDRTRRDLESVFRAAPARAQAGSIRFYDSQRVSIRAVLERPGIVMLTDSNYPGWGAYLDGHRVPILSADYLFRGVAASAGAHEIEFRYEPKSYFCGGLISLSALLAGLAWLIVAARRHRVAGTAI